MGGVAAEGQPLPPELQIGQAVKTRWNDNREIHQKKFALMPDGRGSDVKRFGFSYLLFEIVKFSAYKCPTSDTANARGTARSVERSSIKMVVTEDGAR
jgi:hypothetical protein